MKEFPETILPNNEIDISNAHYDFQLASAVVGREEAEFKLPGIQLGKSELGLGFDQSRNNFFISNPSSSLAKLREHYERPNDLVNFSDIPFEFPNVVGTQITIGRSGFRLQVPGEPEVVYGKDNVLVSGFKKLFDDMEVSRVHCKIEVTQDGVRYADEDSTNGTRLIMPDGQQSETAKVGSVPWYMDIHKSHESKLSYPETVGVAEQPKKGEDIVLINESIGLYGVFDGVGGREHGKKASQKASEVINSELSKVGRGDMSPKDVEEVIKTAFINSSEEVKDEASGGLTTGTVVKVIDYMDKKYAVWASVGDSPLMLFNRNEATLQRISTDEIFSPEQANVITNALGDSVMSVRQIGHFPVNKGQELIICSDGITGDFAPDILSDKEIISVMSNATSPQQAAQGLISISRKDDDKSVVVISIN